MTKEEKNKDLAWQNEDIYTKYRNTDRSTWVLDIADSIAFANGVMWKPADAQALEDANQYPMVDNEVTPCIEQIVGTLTKNPPRWNATGREKSDTTIAANIGDLMEYIWDNSKGNRRLKNSIKDYEITGLMSLMVYIDSFADYGRGEICIRDLDPRKVYIDPNSKEVDSSDAANILIVEYYSKEQAEMLYPDFDFEDAEICYEDDISTSTLHAGENQILDTYDNQYDMRRYRIIDRYKRIKHKIYRVFDPKSNFELTFEKEKYQEYLSKPVAVMAIEGKKLRYLMDAVEVNQAKNLYDATGGSYHFVIDPDTQKQQLIPGKPFSPFAIPNTYTVIQMMTISDFINMGVLEIETPSVNRIQRIISIGRKLYYQTIMPISTYPIKTARLHENRNPYPQGDVKLARPLQEQLNKIDSLIIAYNTNITNVKVFMPKGSYDKEDIKARFGKAGTQVFEYDADEKGAIPIFVQLTQMSNALYNQRQILIGQIQRIIGAYREQEGQMNNAPDTYRATLTLLEHSLERTESKRADIEECLNGIADVVTELIPVVYTERKIIRILKPNNMKKEIAFNDEQKDEFTGATKIVNDLTISKYDVKIVSGSMLPTNKMARSQYFMDLYEKQILRDPTPILRESEIPDVEEIIAKQDQLNQTQQLLAQAQDQIKKLSGQIQSMQRENIHLQKKVEVAGFKSKLNSSASQVSSQVDLTTARLNDLVKNEKNSQKQESNSQN